MDTIVINLDNNNLSIELDIYTGEMRYYEYGEYVCHIQDNLTRSLFFRLVDLEEYTKELEDVISKYKENYKSRIEDAKDTNKKLREALANMDGDYE